MVLAGMVILIKRFRVWFWSRLFLYRWNKKNTQNIICSPKTRPKNARLSRCLPSFGRWISKMLSSSIGIGCFFKIRVEDDIFWRKFQKKFGSKFWLTNLRCFDTIARYDSSGLIADFSSPVSFFWNISSPSGLIFNFLSTFTLTIKISPKGPTEKRHIIKRHPSQTDDNLKNKIKLGSR